ncbi:MAG: uroporphyrinogen-III synthase [Actinomycetota bacterium]
MTPTSADAPLSGLRVAVTRPREQASDLVASLEAVGAEAVSVPVIEIVDPADGGVALASALGSLRPAEWLVVTSPNGAARVGAALADRPLLDGVRIAAVGPATRARLDAAGLSVDLVPDDAIAEGLVAAFPEPPAGGGRVVLARAEVARETLPEQLRALGWEVDEAAAYRTVASGIDAAERAAAADADAVVFTSGSTVDALVRELGAEGLPPLVVSIGPATTAVATDLGVSVTVEARAHTIPGVVDALVRHVSGGRE